jgi:SRSO17 transposase
MGFFPGDDAVTVSFADQLKLAGLQDDTGLIIDEPTIPKKGKHSTAVKRQYCGRQLSLNEAL